MAFTIYVRMKKPGVRRSRELPLVPGQEAGKCKGTSVGTDSSWSKGL